MTSAAWSVDSAVPVAAMARSAATTVGSTGSECTDISGMPHIASLRSTEPRKSKARVTPSVRRTVASSAVRWPRWLERKICRQRTVRPSLVE